MNAGIARWRPLLLGSLPPLLGLLVWCFAADLWQVGPLFVSPTRVLDYAVECLADGQLWQALRASLGRYFAGLALGAGAGLLAGLLLGLSSPGRRLFGPTLRTLQQISLFAWIPLLMAWFGLSEFSKVAFIALAAFFPMLVNAFQGVGDVPASLVEVARVHRFGPLQLLARVVLPAALPALFSGLQLALIYAWLATLGAEYLMVSGEGVGNLLIEGQERYRMEEVLLGVAVVSAVGFTIGALAARLEHLLLRWTRY